MQYMTIGCCFEFLRQAIDGGGKLAEVRDANGMGIRKRADLDLVVVAHIQQRHRFAFVQPLLQTRAEATWETWIGPARSRGPRT